MLKVPDLKPGQEPFDPDFEYHMHPGIQASDHHLAIGGDARSAGADDDSGAILMGMRDQAGGGLRKRRTDPEYQAAALAREILDRVIVKDAVTSLHLEDDTQMKELAAYSGLKICDIIKDQEKFLHAQESKYIASFADDRQRRMFQHMTREYFAQAMIRARALRNRKVREYQIEVIERQNAEFAERALRQENIFNDAAQTAYRDMILFNLDTLYSDLPEAERKEKLDGASLAFYRKVMDRRLEQNPERLQTMLDAPAVKRVLGKELAEEYGQRTAKAIRDDHIRAEAAKWLAEDLNPGAARLEADAVFPDPAERSVAWEHYSHNRHLDNQKIYLTRILNIDQTWRALAEEDYRREAIPAWVWRNDPPLLEFLLKQLAAKERAGRTSPEPDYGYFMDFVAGYDPHRMSERLRDDKELYSFVDTLGGPDSPVFQTSLRLLLGKLTGPDEALLRDMRQACESFSLSGAEESFRNVFLSRFYCSRRIQMAREDVTEFTDAEVTELIESSLPK